jgi:class 3 adenylate cyclase/tetratricopeptide (TPR) repeat protein
MTLSGRDRMASAGSDVSDSSTVTLLFTDLVGSTELLRKLGEEDAERLRRTHFGLLRDAICASGGHEVKNLGDGLMVVFPSARDAVGCAAAMQQAVEHHNRLEGQTALAVRVGVEVGEPVREEDDYFGTPVVVAKRLCDAAAGGQVLVSDLVRQLVGTRGDFVFREIGRVELKGLGEPVPAWSLDWAAEKSRESPIELVGHPVRPAALPPGLVTSLTTRLVDRERELERLRDAWRLAESGGTQVVFLAGEPGIGKTRLASELVREVLADGGAVLYGRCDEESVVPYQPFVEALRQLVTRGWVTSAAASARRYELARLLPELAERVPRPPGRPPDPETDRYQLFEAVATLLDSAARSRTVLLVLDDLHWAGKPTVQLLRYLVHSVTPAGLLVVGTYRDADVPRDHPLADLLFSLRRDNLGQRIQVRGLSAAEVAELVESRTDPAFQPAGRAVADALWRKTSGNPLFVVEMLRHRDETGRLDLGGLPGAQRLGVRTVDVPEGIRDLVLRRMSRLSQTANTVLTAAAILSGEIEFDVLARMLGLEEDALLSALEEALRAGVVVEVEGRPASTYAFSHALVREAMLAELSRPRRERLHLRAAQALEQSIEHTVEQALQQAAEEALRSRIGALALHYRSAGTACPRETAIDYSLRAGDAAAAALDWDEAAYHWEAALDILESQEAEPERRAELLARLADAMHVTGFDLARGIEYLKRELALRDAMKDEQCAARVHSRLGRELSTYFEVMDMEQAMRHFDLAERVLGREPQSGACANLQSRRAGAAVWTIRSEEGAAAARRALAFAERHGAAGLRAGASMQLGWHLVGLGSLREGLALLDGAWDDLDQLNHRHGAFSAAIGRGIIAMLLLDPLEATRWFERELRKPRVAEAPIQRRSLAASLAWARVVSGRPPAALRAEQEPGAALLGLVCAPPLDYWAGRWDTAAAAFLRDETRARRAGSAFEQWGVAVWLAEIHRVLGEYPEAVDRLTGAVEIPATSPHRLAELVTRIKLALCHAEAGTPERSREHLDRALELMSPQEDWRGVAGRFALSEAVMLGAEGRHDEAAPGYEQALDTFHQLSLPWEEAEALLLWSRALRRAGDAERADHLAHQALTLYHALGAGPSWTARARTGLPGRGAAPRGGPGNGASRVRGRPSRSA